MCDVNLAHDLGMALPDCVEVRHDGVWTKCFSIRSPGEMLNPVSGTLPTYVMANVPTAAPLRLQMTGVKELAGPHILLIGGHRARSVSQSFWFRLFQRLPGYHAIPLNPFDPTPIIYADTIAMTEFKAP